MIKDKYMIYLGGGRVLRPSEGKEHAIIIDQVGAVKEHGLVCDERYWTLDDRKKKGGDKAENPVKICSDCFSALPAGVSVCSNCGYVFTAAERAGPEQINGDLAELDKAAFRKQRKDEERNAKSLEDLIELGIKRGYKNPRFWAEMKFSNSRWRRG